MDTRSYGWKSHNGPWCGQATGAELPGSSAIPVEPIKHPVEHPLSARITSCPPWSYSLRLPLGTVGDGCFISSSDSMSITVVFRLVGLVKNRDFSTVVSPSEGGFLVGAFRFLKEVLASPRTG